MKYLAILKDSLREAIDTKVFYVMVALSALLMLFVASISYRPLSAEEELTSGLAQLNWVLAMQARNQGQKEAARFEITDFQQLNDAAEPWLGDYRFTARMHWPQEKDSGKSQMGQVRGLVRALRGLTGASSDPVTPLLQARFPWLNIESSTETRAAGPNEEAYVITTRGTKITRLSNWPHETTLFFGAVPLGAWGNQSLGQTVHFVEDTLVNGIGAWVAILVGVVITAFFIPNMLRKGSVDLLLVRPIHRPTLLIFKYLGGLSFMLVNSAVVVTGIWLILGLRTGIWSAGFLCSILILTFFFAILYAVSALFGVLTRSPVVAILMTCVVWFVLWLVGFVHGLLETVRQRETQEREVAAARAEEEDFDPDPMARLKVPDWVYTTVNAIHFVLPRTKDLDRLTTRLLSRELLTEDQIRQANLDRIPPVSWGESLAVSGAFIAVMLGVACWWFATKDY